MTLALTLRFVLLILLVYFSAILLSAAIRPAPQAAAATPYVWSPVPGSALATLTASPAFVSQDPAPSEASASPPSPSPSATRTRPAPTRKPRTAVPSVAHHVLTGTATWYAYHRGQAAAGYRLRNALGPHWRGMVVTVCASRCVRVVLTDYMGSTNHAKVIDLDAGDFAVLAPLGQGIVKVEILR